MAAAQQCRLPDRLTVSPCDRREESRGRKGDFDHYILSFSWSPAFCASEAGQRSIKSGATLQCRDNRFGWIVHGLWPQYAERRAGQFWPQYCGPVQPVPAPVLRRHLCASPDPRLMQCEWAKHGSCSDFATPEEYFAAQTRLADSLTLPEPQPGQSARAFATAVVAANTGRGLERRHLRVVGGGTAGIREVRICFERDLDRFRPC
ncbi:MAG: hypothetical protein CTR53_02485 [Ferrovibrio sp.]|nr:MAG: hypothetical protein CTR53_02485 [Ferrovibrio sp.]